MEVREFNQLLDYNRVSEWWKHYGFEPLHPSLLPQTGLMVDDICVGWLYKTDSAFAVMEWIVADPSSSKEKRDEALDILIQSLLRVAKKEGYIRVFTSTPHKKLAERFEKLGLIKAEESSTNFIGRTDEIL